MMKRYGLLTVLCALVLLAVPAAAEEAFTHWAPGFYDAALKAQETELTHRFLTERQVKAAFDRPIVVEVTAADLEEMERGQAFEPRLRVGVAKPADVEVRLGNQLFKARRVGALDLTGDGFVWSAVVRSPGAVALRLHLTDLQLPAGVELYVYNARGQAFGPFTESGELWPNTTFGAEAVIQLHYQGDEVPAALSGVHFRIADVGHLTDKFLQGRSQGSLFEKDFCSFNEPCVENASCSSMPGAISAARDAIAEMLFVSGGWYYICTGGLIADTDDTSEIPYFLTANHCIGKSRVAATLEAFFQFVTPCGGECYDFEGAGLPSTLGATLVSTSRTSDYSLLELAEPAPGGTAFLGWNSTPVAFADGTVLHRISHPSGAPQAYSRHVVDTSKVTCSGWPRGDWIYSHDVYGATEGGSSGSPVLNGDGQVVGQLTGACGYNVNDPCDADSNATVDGAFAAYFDAVKPWLDPGGGECLPDGSACTDNAECCSNKCAGKVCR